MALNQTLFMSRESFQRETLIIELQQTVDQGINTYTHARTHTHTLAQATATTTSVCRYEDRKCAQATTTTTTTTTNTYGIDMGNLFFF